jgi:hypothetical protein
MDLKTQSFSLLNCSYLPNTRLFHDQLSTHGHLRPELDSTKGRKHGIKNYEAGLIFLVGFPDADIHFRWCTKD